MNGGADVQASAFQFSCMQQLAVHVWDMCFATLCIVEQGWW